MVTLATLVATLLPLSLLSDLLKRYAVDQPQEYGLIERRRAIQWGRLYRGESYLWIALPSWDWRKDDFYFGSPRGDWSWHQRVLVWYSRRGWFVWYRPEAA